MKRSLCLLMIILMIFTFAGCRHAENNISGDIWVCPLAIDPETHRVKEGFADCLTDPDNWPTVLKHTKVLKLYIQQIYTTTDEDLKKIADFVKKQSLKVAIELGGVRMASGSLPKEERGNDAYNNEFGHVLHFIELGGRCDYITTDHALAETISGRGGFRDMTMQEIMAQQAVYYKMAQEAVPGLKVGAIESLGYFWVKTEEKQYQSTDPYLNRVDFEDYISELIRICGENGVEIDHFHIDFGLQDIEYDGDYGRVLAVEDKCHDLGIDTGFICTNAFHASMVYPSEDPKAEAKSAAERALKYFTDYIKAGGRSDYLLFQRWQNYPSEIGPETDPLTNFGIFKTLIDSKWFPK